jgi:hypothetical protein
MTKPYQINSTWHNYSIIWRFKGEDDWRWYVASPFMERGIKASTSPIAFQEKENAQKLIDGLVNANGNIDNIEAKVVGVKYEPIEYD